jgi:hypothetical protein
MLVQVMSSAMILICANQQSALCLLGLQSSVKVLREVHTWILYLTTAGSSSQTWQGIVFYVHTKSLGCDFWPASQIVYWWEYTIEFFMHVLESTMLSCQDFLTLFLSKGSIGTWHGGRPAGEGQLVGRLAFQSLCAPQCMQSCTVSGGYY